MTAIYYIKHLHDLQPLHIGAWFMVAVPKPYLPVKGKVQYLGAHKGSLPPIVASWCAAQGHHDPHHTFMWYRFSHPNGLVREFTQAFTTLWLTQI